MEAWRPEISVSLHRADSSESPIYEASNKILLSYDSFFSKSNFFFLKKIPIPVFWRRSLLDSNWLSAKEWALHKKPEIERWEKSSCQLHPSIISIIGLLKYYLLTYKLASLRGNSFKNNFIQYHPKKINQLCFLKKDDCTYMWYPPKEKWMTLLFRDQNILNKHFYLFIGLVTWDSECLFLLTDVR